MTNIELMFTASFQKNHRKTSQETINEIYKTCPDKSGLTNTLIKMIQETYESLMDEPEENEGNAKWEVVDLSPKKSHE